MPLVATISSSPDSPVTSTQQGQAKDILRSLTHQSPTKMAIGSGNHVFYYMVRDTLCFLTMAESSYPKRTAFLYLEEIADIILNELLKEFGNEVRSIRNKVVWFLDSFSHRYTKYYACRCLYIIIDKPSGGPKWTLLPGRFDSFITIL